jgi:predicted O-methyltransferase YrrM
MEPSGIKKETMEHFYHTIQGWFNYESIYDRAVQSAGSDAHFVEVGSWRGRSTAYMAVIIANSGKRIRFDAVDTWRGSPAEAVHMNDPAVIADTLYNEFIANMEPVKSIVNPIRMTSVAAAETYPDASLDFVLIDGSHEYQDVVDDILAWKPKLKPGSVLAGDDYAWPGVQRAVMELLPDAEIVNGLGHWLYTVK